MKRIMPPVTDQANSHYLRNVLCRLETPERQARVSCHLRNVAVCEALALIGFLDGHPRIKGRPAIARGPAAFQQQGGTHDNPFCHVAPANMLLNGANLTTYFQLAENQARVARIFGMGVNAPDNWAELNTFTSVPAQQNRSDNLTERHASSFGLVAAFEAAAASGTPDGAWLADGKRRRDRASLVDFVRRHYDHVWKGAAMQAYERALTHLQGRIAAAVAGNGPGPDRLRDRLAIVAVQRDQLLTGLLDLPAVLALTLQALEKERWR